MRAAEEMEVDEEVTAEAERPTKVVTADVAVTVRARVLQFDFEGRSDGRSIRTILTHIAPRHLILVHASPEVCLLVEQHLLLQPSLEQNGWCERVSCNTTLSIYVVHRARCEAAPSKRQRACCVIGVRVRAHVSLGKGHEAGAG